MQKAWGSIYNYHMMKETEKKNIIRLDRRKLNSIKEKSINDERLAQLAISTPLLSPEKVVRKN